MVADSRVAEMRSLATLLLSCFLYSGLSVLIIPIRTHQSQELLPFIDFAVIGTFAPTVDE
jgi:hypothetical protein